MRKNFKLPTKWYESFEVIAKIGLVAYKLKLPPTNSLHLVFSVSLFKKKVGEQAVVLTDLPTFREDTVLVPQN